MDTERMEFKDGNWVEFRTYLTHGAVRRVQAATKQYLRPTEPVRFEDKGNGQAGFQETDVVVDWERFEQNLANDALILACTIEWSYGEVTQENLDLLRVGNYDQILQRMNELYGSVPLAESAKSP